ncbi:jg14853 [Pararge aegeria aegeria]|uniref:Jg14853 protein n=1 Tax=Pararge aegeria aegeria TaxID=348720 RepID=A0A8S4R2F9_9NEOP|nr:jg14853 [Pararge aegeria aegeria]
MRVRKISRVHEDLVDIIRKVAAVTNITNIENFVEYGTDEIDSFLSWIHKVNIKGVRDGVLVNIKVMIKWHSNPIDRKCFRASYHREYVFYEIIVPNVIKLQRGFSIIEGLKIKFPNCALASIVHDKETIAIYMSNDTRPLDRFQKIDFAHTSLVLKNLAKLHALSFALQKLYPDDFEMIRNLCAKDIQYADLESIPKCLISYYKSSINVISKPVAKAKLEVITPNILALLNKCSAPVPNYSTICHGDCWNNNILFKYQGKRPVDVLFVDYQLVRYASPVTDISYFLYMSADQKLLSKHYYQLLDIYFGTLTAVLRQCNLNIDDIYPRNIFLRHLRDYSVLGLLEALISLKITTAETEDALKITDMKYHAEEPCQYETQNQSMYVERVNGVVTDFFERNYSLDAILKQ